MQGDECRAENERLRGKFLKKRKMCLLNMTFSFESASKEEWDQVPQCVGIHKKSFEVLSAKHEAIG